MKCLLWMVLALLPLSARAAPPTDESLMALFRVTRAESLVENIYASLEPMMRQSIAQSVAGKALSPEQQRLIDLAPARLSETLRAELNWAALMPIQMRIYRETFDQNEINGLIAFYQTPLGQSFVTKMPQVAQRSMVETQALMQQVFPKIRASLESILIEARIPPR